MQRGDHKPDRRPRDGPPPDGHPPDGHPTDGHAADGHPPDGPPPEGPPPDGPPPNRGADPPRAPGTDALADAAARAGGNGPPPVHLWNPPFCGDLDIRIARDGTWFYLGTPIGRRPLVKLFASILRREGDRHYLVTPVEKVGIRVDDAPFVAVDLAASGKGRGQAVTFTTDVGDETAAGPENPLRLVLDPATGEPAPYVHVRRGLEALIDRKTFYRLVALGTEHPVDGADHFGVWSGGVFFPFLPSAELERLGA